MSAADALQALGAVLIGLAACCAVWAGRCARPLDLAAAGFCFSVAMGSALVALRLAHGGHALVLYVSVALLLMLGGRSGAEWEGARGPMRGAQMLALGGVGLMAGLLLAAGPLVRAAPSGAARTRRALLESDIAEGMQAALLTFNAGWLVSALAVLTIAALCVMVLLAEPPGSSQMGHRS